MRNSGAGPFIGRMPTAPGYSPKVEAKVSMLRTSIPCAGGATPFCEAFGASAISMTVCLPVSGGPKIMRALSAKYARAFFALILPPQPRQNRTAHIRRRTAVKFAATVPSVGAPSLVKEITSPSLTPVFVPTAAKSPDAYTRPA